jgi:hypothetical protein
MRWSVGLLILSSCELSPMSSPPLDSSPASLERALGAELEVCDLECRAEPTDIFSSFVVTDPVILDRFPLRRVLDQLATLASGRSAMTTAPPSTGSRSSARAPSLTSLASRSRATAPWRCSTGST